MKLSLVVSQGVHEGRVIPVPVPEFVIGRDEGCHLRPASQAISKRHCAIVVKDGKLWVRDFGSTNGTFVNDAQVDGEIEVKAGDKVRVGPLEFVIKLEPSAKLSPSRAEPKSGISRPTPPPKSAPAKETKPAAPAGEPDPEQLAALLLSTDDGSSEPMTEDKIPSGSTVFEVPPIGADPNPKPEQKKSTPEADNSKRAAEILKKYMQRPRS